VDSGQEWQSVRDQVRLLVHGLREQPEIRQAVATHDRSRLAAECADLGIPIIPLPWFSGTDPRALRELARHARDGWDVYHAHDATALALMLYIQALVGSDAAIVASRRFSAPPRSVARWHRADVVLAVSGPARDALIAEGIERRRVHVVPNCVVAEETGNVVRGALRAAVGASPEHRLVASFTALNPHRDHATLIEAAALLRQRAPQARFVVLGRGPERRFLEDLVEVHDLEGRVCLPGFLPDARQYMGDIDVFVMPSLREEVTSACLEAMAAGVPVVMPAAERATDPAWEAVPAGDPEALATALERLFRDQRHRDGIVRRGREFALRHGPPALVSRTLAAYRAVCRQQRRRAS
jgi:glycosyltransferase involved in cell wall biosynthesis